MGYKITYGKTVIHKSRHRSGKRNWKIIKAVGVVVALVGVLVWPKGREAVTEAVIPGDDEVTKRAFHGLVDDVGDGMKWHDALQAFCWEIMDND